MHECQQSDGLLISLARQFWKLPDGFDTSPYIFALQQAVLLTSSRSSSRAQLQKEIDKVDPQALGFRTSILQAMEQVLHPFDWITFLRDRIGRTYKFANWDTSRKEIDWQRCIDQVKLCRPVLITCWLRWTLHSIPTSRRLHDGLHGICPFCNTENDDIAHLMGCANAYSHAVQVLCSRANSANVSIFRERRASHLLSMARPFGLAAESFIFDTNEKLPLSFISCVCARLALHEVELLKVQMRLCLLYLIQYSFIALRSRRCAGEAISDADLTGSMHATYSTLV